MSKSKTRPRGSITKKGDGSWLVRVSHGVDANGRRVRINKVVHGTKADANRVLTAMLKRGDDGETVALSKQSVREWIDEWLGTWCTGISERTKRDYENLMRRYMPQELLAKRLTALSATDVQYVLNSLSARGLSARTVRYFHTALRRALNVAVKIGRLAQNVARNAEPPRQDRREMHALTPDQVRALFEAAKGTRLESLWHVLATVGLRPAEAFGLLWSDLDGSMLRVQRSLLRPRGGGWELGEPKTERARRAVALPASTVRALASHRARQAEEKLRAGASYVDRGFIFATPLGDPLELGNVTSREFKPLLEKAGLPPSVRLYDLRHTAATLRLLNREHPAVVSQMLGHAKTALTLDVYSHVLPSMQEEAASRLDALLYPPAGHAAVG